MAFWNLVGAGIFGFMINPPIVLYCMQGLNTTPVHAHAAPFGVYGMLGIGLVLFCMRAMRPTAHWNERLLAVGFWAMTIGLMAMIALSVFPINLVQTWASVEPGYADARSPELMQLPYLKTLRWMRIPGATLFAVGAVAVIAFVFGVGRRSSTAKGALWRPRRPSSIPRRCRPRRSEPAARREITFAPARAEQHHPGARRPVRSWAISVRRRCTNTSASRATVHGSPKTSRS